MKYYNEVCNYKKFVINPLKFPKVKGIIWMVSIIEPMSWSPGLILWFLNIRYTVLNELVKEIYNI